ncbi:MAG: hypothetical protein LIP11_14175 [Clostridiales bacterium]|nr:hypothetical protein [Clostridiales bacterium]
MKLPLYLEEIGKLSSDLPVLVEHLPKLEDYIKGVNAVNKLVASSVSYPEGTTTTGA